MAPRSSRLRISVIVPVHGEGEEPASLLEQLTAAPEVVEVWLVEAPSDPAPVPISLGPGDKVRRVSSLERGRATQMNLGAELAEGELLLFLHADSRLAAGALPALVEAFQARSVDAAAFRFAFREPDPRLWLLGALGRAVASINPYAFGDQGFAVRRERFLRDGAFPNVPLLEDWLAVRRYRGEGTFRLLEIPCRTSGRRFLERGVLRQVWQNASLLYRFSQGVPLERLAEEYRRGPEGPDRGVVPTVVAAFRSQDGSQDRSPSRSNGRASGRSKAAARISTAVLAGLLASYGLAVGQSTSGPAAISESVQEPGPLWEAFDALLGARVDEDGLVRYVGILDDPDFVRAWQRLQAVTEAELGAWPVPEQIAFWINAYNLATLRLIGEHYPIQGRFPIDLIYPDNSILMIPGRWDNAYEIAGETRSLDSIEHEILRRQFQEPRIHFAIVCASLGCPVLRREAFRGTELESQLEDQAVRYFGRPTGLRFEPRSDRSRPRVELTKILDWFGDDFSPLEPDPAIRAVQRGDRGELVARVARWFPEDVRQALRSRRADFGWIDYDWTLNERAALK
ncbi:MAG: DUF547 domain-containing protein [Candidatus Eisenbacteria bacterium]|nr:DUF547 domain-containing protein [Candidatus Eisenbacteria bacterium]